MSPPKKVRIAPFTFTVEYVKLTPGATASVNPDVEAIVLERGQSALAERDSLLHETLHACLVGIKTRLSKLDPDVEEEIVATMAPRILGLLRDNPGFVDYLLE